jgi:hypothetical protein
MIVSNAALRAVASVITCKLQECATDGDDELTMQAIRNVHSDFVDDAEEAGMIVHDKDVPTLPAERAAVMMAREYAGVLGAMLDRLLHPNESEYTDENDEDQIWVHEMLMDYGAGFGNADAGEHSPDHDKLYDALMCSIDAKALRLWLSEQNTI